VGVSGDSGYPAWGRWELDMVGLQDPELHRESEGSGCAGTPGLCIPGSLHPCPRVLCTPGPAPQAPPDSPCPGPGLCFERLPGAQAPWGPGAVPCPPPQARTVLTAVAPPSRPTSGAPGKGSGY
jgi:hypothetical protein